MGRIHPLQEIPAYNLTLEAWWRELAQGRLSCGYGGARSPEEPQPIVLPEHVSRIEGDYRAQMSALLMPAPRHLEESRGTPSRHPDIPSVEMRVGTTLEHYDEGSVVILELLYLLFTYFVPFYREFRKVPVEKAFPNNRAWMLARIEKIVQIRLFIAAIQADVHLPPAIDKYIMDVFIPMLPDPPPGQ